jgi:hypothetical protein
LALRDKLRDLSKGLEGIPLERVISDWMTIIDDLLSEIEGYCADYVRDQLLSLTKAAVWVAEDGISQYSAPCLEIKSGAERVLVHPIGRFVAGADGRVDMSRVSSDQDKSALRRVMMLRIHNDVGKFQWLLELSPRAKSRSDDVVFDSDIPLIEDLARGIPLNRKSFEAALEFVLA